MDTMQRNAPAAKAELALLQAIKVGDVRREPLFPAIEVGMEWICTAARESLWEFDGLFFGQLLCRVVITVTDDVITMDVKETA